MQKGISVITTPIYVVDRFIVYFFLTLGLSSSVYQKELVQLDNEKSRDELTSSLQGLATTTCCIALSIYLVFRKPVNSFFAVTDRNGFSYFCGGFSNNSILILGMRLRVNYRCKKLVLMTIFTSIAKPVFGIMGILFPAHKVEARIYALMLVEVVAYLGLYFFQFVKG